MCLFITLLSLLVVRQVSQSNTLKYRIFWTINRLFSVWFSHHYLNIRPFDNWTQIYHLNTRLIRYSDGHCTCICTRQRELPGALFTKHITQICSVFRPANAVYLLIVFHWKRWVPHNSITFMKYKLLCQYYKMSMPVWKNMDMELNHWDVKSCK